MAALCGGGAYVTLISSWIDTANAEGCPFPVNNLPCGVASRKDEARKRCVVAIGDFALDLTALERSGLFSKEIGRAHV